MGKGPGDKRLQVHDEESLDLTTLSLQHFENICSAINQLPSELNFEVPPLSEATGLSQDLGNLMQSDASCASIPDEQGSQSSNVEQQAVTPDTSFSGVAKRRKGRKLADGLTSLR